MRWKLPLLLGLLVVIAGTDSLAAELSYLFVGMVAWWARPALFR